MSVSTRLRFEVLKRDGFRCRYCGTTALESPLHVDHVIAQADGGGDDPTNLVAASASCNLGKSDKPLDRSTLSQSPESAALLYDHAAHPIDRVLRSIDATAANADRLPTNVRVITYFRACLRNFRDEEPPAVDPFDAARDAADLVASVLTTDLRTTAAATAKLENARRGVNQQSGPQDVIAGAFAGLGRAIQRAGAKPNEEPS